MSDAIAIAAASFMVGVFATLGAAAIVIPYFWKEVRK